VAAFEGGKPPTQIDRKHGKYFKKTHLIVRLILKEYPQLAARCASLSLATESLQQEEVALVSGLRFPEQFEMEVALNTVGLTNYLSTVRSAVQEWNI